MVYFRVTAINVEGSPSLSTNTQRLEALPDVPGEPWSLPAVEQRLSPATSAASECGPVAGSHRHSAPQSHAYGKSTRPENVSDGSGKEQDALR